LPSLPPKQLKKLKRRNCKLKLTLLIGRDKLKRHKKSQLNNNRKQLLPLQLEKLNLRLKDRGTKPSMMLLSKNRLRLTDLPHWQQMKLTELLNLQGKLKRRSKSLLIRDKWPLEGLPSKKPSETCGLLEILVFRSST